MALTQTLIDNFNINVINTNLWSVFGPVTPLNQVKNVNGRLEITTDGVSGNYYSLQSVATYDLTSSYAFIKVVSAGNQAANFDCIPLLLVDTGGTNKLYWDISGGTLAAVKVVANVQTTVLSTSYVPDTHRWLMIRELSGTTFFDYSSDGKFWVNFTSLANPITVTALFIEMQAGQFGAASVDTHIVDGLNVLPTGGTTTSTSSTSSTSSSTSSTSSSISSTSSSMSSTSISVSSTSSSTSTSSTSVSSTSSSTSISSTSSSSTSSSTTISSTSSSISSTSYSSTSVSSTSRSFSTSSTSSSISSTSSSISSTSSSISSTSASSTSSSSSTSTTAPPIQIFSYQNTLALSSTPTGLIDSFNGNNYADVAVDDGGYFIEYGSKYVIAVFKMVHQNSIDSISVRWSGRSTYPTTKAPIFLQIYNVFTSAWETLASETRKPADTDFSLSAVQYNNAQNYYDTKKTVTFRVYQQVS